jgi:hypothetical protein
MANAVSRAARLLPAVALMVLPAIAYAQAQTAAQALFDDGRRLLKEGNVPAACAKFAESQRLEPAGGTLMNLASCHARSGKTATAWLEFTDALTQATRDGREDRVQEAKRQLAELEPQLARITVTVDPTAPKSIEVLLDGTRLGAGAWGTALPVDPGDHEVSASAPGFVTFRTHATIASKERETIAVPALAPAPAEQAHEGTERTASRPPVLGWALVGVAILGIGAGTYFGLDAAKKKDDGESRCTPAGCTSEGASLLRQANGSAWGSNIGFAIGGIALLGAAYLFFIRPSSTTSAVSRFSRMGLSW